MQDETKLEILSKLAETKRLTGRYNASRVAKDLGLHYKDVERLKLAAQRGGVSFIYR